MPTSKRPRPRPFARLLLAATTLLLHEPGAGAQTSALLQLTTIQADHGQPVQFNFTDAGTGATNYMVEFREGLESGASWQTASNAVITAQGNGGYSVLINSAQETRAFYRVVGLGGTNGPIIIDFSSTAFQVVEGDDVFPMLVLSQPFSGIVHYTVSGTASSGDYMALSGQVVVNGTTATIPVSLTDNEAIGRLRYLTLRLSPGAGYAVGRDSATTINIDENDADWQGRMFFDEGITRFVLRIQESNGVHMAALIGDTSGFFPAGATASSITFGTDSFSAFADNVGLPASATRLNSEVLVALSLTAANGVTNQSVSSTQVQGAARLVMSVPGYAQLNTTNQGTFILLKPPVTPSTNEVQLTNVP